MMISSHKADYHTFLEWHIIPYDYCLLNPCFRKGEK